MSIAPLTAERRVELFYRFSQGASLIDADETSWNRCFVLAKPIACLEACGSQISVLLEQLVAQISSCTRVCGFAIRLDFPVGSKLKVFLDAVKSLQSAMPHPPERTLLFASEHGEQLFDLQLLIQMEGV